MARGTTIPTIIPMFDEDDEEVGGLGSVFGV